MYEFLGPQDYCEITLDLTELAKLCPLNPRPLLVTGIVVQWLRQHFTFPITIETSLLQDYLWTDDIRTTKIMIDSVAKWQPALTEKRPALLIKRGPWKVLNYGIDNRKMLTSDDCNCPSQYLAMFQGSLTVFCIGGESAEAELLGTEVYRELMQFGPQVRSKTGFLRFLVSDIGEVSLLEESKEHFVVPIVVSYGLQDEWLSCPPL